MKKIFAIILVVITVVPATAQLKSNKWINLFNGKDLSGWKERAGTADYQVKDGMIVGTTVANSPNSFLVTNREFDDFILEMDVMIDDTSSNSGVQLRSHYNDTANKGNGKVYGYQYELDPSSRKWTAGIYDEGRRDWLYPLTLNPAAQDAFKLHVFNKIKMECFHNSIRTWINGQPAAYLIDTFDHKGFIGLQVHAVSKPGETGKKIYWKNIRIMPVTKSLPDFPVNIFVVNNIPNNLSAYEKKNGWKLLFDGKTSTGWRGIHNDNFPTKRWTVTDGTLSLSKNNGSPEGGDIVTKKQFSAFELSFEFKLTTGANSGVKYFVTLPTNDSGAAIGLEYQLLDDDVHPDAKLGRDGDRKLASLYDLIPAQKQQRFVHAIGSWNMGRIIVYPNNHVEHYLNGIKVLEYDRGSSAYRDLVAISKFKVFKNFGEGATGCILLQDHGDAVSFRSIKIRVL